MNPTILPSSYEKIVGQTMHFNLTWQPILEKENSEFKPVELHFKIDQVLLLVHMCVWGGGR